MIGRRDEVAALLDAMAERRPTLVVGPAGIGKTTVARAARAATGGPWTVTAAMAALSLRAYGPLRPVLRGDTRGGPDAVAARLEAALGDRSLFVEDLHWADPDSLAVLAHLAERVPLLATWRDRGVDGRPPVAAVAEWNRVEVPALTPDESDRVVRLRHPDMDPDARHHLVTTAAGNPLLLEELPGGPGLSLIEALLDRLGDLSPEGRDAFEHLCVARRPRLLPPELRNELLAAGLVAPGPHGEAPGTEDEVVPRHALLAEAAVDGLTATRRRQLSLDEAERASGPDEAVQHLIDAGLPDRARAAALTAARTSVSSRTAGALLAVASGLATGDEAQALRLAAADALIEGGDHSACLDLLGGDLPADREQRAEILRRRGQSSWALGDQAGVIASYFAAMDAARGTDTPVEAWLLSQTVLVQLFVPGSADEAMATAEQALALATRVSGEELVAETRVANAWSAVGRTGWPDRFEAVITDARAPGVPVRVRLDALEGLILGHWGNGRPEALATATRAVHESELAGAEGWGIVFAAYAAVLHMSAEPGPDRHAATLADLLDDHPSFRNRPFAEAALAVCLADGGRERAARHRLDVAGPGLSGNADGASRCWAEAELARNAGDDERALAQARAAVGGMSGAFPMAVAAQLVGGHAAIDLGLDLPGAACAAWPGHEPARREWEGLVLAAASRHGDAATAFGTAAEAWSGSDRRAAIRCRIAAARWAAREGRPDAGNLARAAVAEAAAVGWRSMVARAGAWLGTAVDSPVATAVHPLLSPRQTEVMALVADGATTTAIAARLGLSPATVESHVTGARRRLGAPNRRAAALQVVSDLAEVGPTAGDGTTG